MMPSLFISHGPPDRVTSSSPAKTFLTQLGGQLPKPKAIIIFSAHWFSKKITLSANGTNDILHDMYGFNPELYQVKYHTITPAWLAESVTDILDSENIEYSTSNRGLDHGAWSVLKLAYPDGSIPVIGVSIPVYENFEDYLMLGALLKPLRKSGYLIIGSGSATHNLSELQFNNSKSAWAQEYVDWLQQAVLNHNYDDLATPYQANKLTRKAHPTPDHYIPLLIAAGAGMNEAVDIIHDSYEYGTLNNTSFRFGDTAHH